MSNFTCMRFVDVDRLTDGFPFNNMKSAHEKDEPKCSFCFVVSCIIIYCELHNCTVIHDEVCVQHYYVLSLQCKEKE